MIGKNVALITGGCGDIGTAIIKQLHGKYRQIIALDVIDEYKAACWQTTLDLPDDKTILFQHLDVGHFSECEHVIADIIKNYGGIDLVVNNAGITRDAVFNKMTVDQWNDVLKVNLDGMFNVTRQVVETMSQQQYGRIINISSVNAQRGQFSQANYAASKAGIYGFTKSLAQELMKKNITVNSISPGYVNTCLMQGIRADILTAIISQIPAKRLAEPKEIAWAVDFLADDNSSYITGANLSINGGLHMD